MFYVGGLAFLDTNMLVSPTQIFALGEPPNAKNCCGLNASSFALEWNIGLTGIVKQPAFLLHIVNVDIFVVLNFRTSSPM